MAQTIALYVRCSQCGGDGVFSPSSGEQGTTIPCNWPGCVNGSVLFGQVTLDPGLDDILDKVNDVKEKTDEIKDVVEEIRKIIQQ